MYLYIFIYRMYKIHLKMFNFVACIRLHLSIFCQSSTAYHIFVL